MNWSVPTSTQRLIAEKKAAHEAQCKELAASFAWSELKAGYCGSSGSWRGVIKSPNGDVVYTCDHTHHNREQSTRTNGRSAVDCVGRVIGTIHELQDPEYAYAMRCTKRPF
jgi:hypothetical protein